MPINEEVLIHIRGVSQNLEREIDNALKELDRLEQFYINLNKRIGEIGGSQKELLSGISGPETQRAIQTTREVDQNFQETENSIRSADDALDDFNANRPEPVELTADTDDLRQALQDYDRLSTTRPPEPAKLIEESAPEIREKGEAAAEAIRVVRREDSESFEQLNRSIFAQFQRQRALSGQFLDPAAQLRNDQRRINITRAIGNLEERFNRENLDASRVDLAFRDRSLDLTREELAAFESRLSNQQQTNSELDEFSRKLEEVSNQEQERERERIRLYNRRAEANRGVLHSLEEIERQEQAGIIPVTRARREEPDTDRLIRDFQRYAQTLREAQAEEQQQGRSLLDLENQAADARRQRFLQARQEFEARQATLAVERQITQAREPDALGAAILRQQEASDRRRATAQREYAEQLARTNAQEEERIRLADEYDEGFDRFRSYVDYNRDLGEILRENNFDLAQTSRLFRQIRRSGASLGDLSLPDLEALDRLISASGRDLPQLDRQLREIEARAARLGEIDIEIEGPTDEDLARLRDSIRQNQDLNDILRERNIDQARAARLFRDIESTDFELSRLSQDDRRFIGTIQQLSGRDLPELSRQFREIETRTRRWHAVLNLLPPTFSRFGDFTRQVTNLTRSLGLILLVTGLIYAALAALPTILGAVGAAVVVLAGIATNRYTRAMQRAEVSTGLLTSELQAAHAATSQLGLSVDDTAARFASAEDVFNRIRFNPQDTEADEALRELGLNLDAIVNRGQSTTQTLTEISAAVALLDQPQAINFLRRIFGNDDEIITLLLSGRLADAISDVSGNFRQLSDSEFRLTENVGNSLRRLTGTSFSLLRGFVADAGGSIDELFQRIEDRLPGIARGIAEFFIPEIERVERNFDRIWERGEQFFRDAEPTFDRIALRLQQAANVFTAPGLTGPQLVDFGAILIALNALTALISPLSKISSLFFRLGGFLVGLVGGPLTALVAGVGIIAATVLAPAALRALDRWLTGLGQVRDINEEIIESEQRIENLTNLIANGRERDRVALENLLEQERERLTLLRQQGEEQAVVSTLGRTDAAVREIANLGIQIQNLEQQALGTGGHQRRNIQRRIDALREERDAQIAIRDELVAQASANAALAIQDAQAQRRTSLQQQTEELLNSAFRNQLDLRQQLADEAAGVSSRFQDISKAQRTFVSSLQEEEELGLGRQLSQYLLDLDQVEQTLNNFRRLETRGITIEGELFDSDQIERAEASIEDYQRRLQSLREDETLSTEEKRSQVQAILEAQGALRGYINDLESPAQIAFAEDIKAEVDLVSRLTNLSAIEIQQYIDSLRDAQSQIRNTILQGSDSAVAILDNANVSLSGIQALLRNIASAEDLDTLEQYLFQLAQIERQSGLTANQIANIAPALVQSQREFNAGFRQDLSLEQNLRGIGTSIREVEQILIRFRDSDSIEGLAQVERELQAIEMASGLTRTELASLIDDLRTNQLLRDFQRLSLGFIDNFNSSIGAVVAGLTTIEAALENFARQSLASLVETSLNQLTRGITQQLQEALDQRQSLFSGGSTTQRLLGGGINLGGNIVNEALGQGAGRFAAGKAVPSIYNEINVYGSDPNAAAAGVEEGNNRWLDTPQGRAFLGSQVDEERQ